MFWKSEDYTWSEEARLDPSGGNFYHDESEIKNFGERVATTGNTVLVGAPLDSHALMASERPTFLSDQ